jgi:hypothetical protein
MHKQAINGCDKCETPHRHPDRLTSKHLGLSDIQPEDKP